MRFDFNVNTVKKIIKEEGHTVMETQLAMYALEMNKKLGKQNNKENDEYQLLKSIQNSINKLIPPPRKFCAGIRWR